MVSRDDEYTVTIQTEAVTLNNGDSFTIEKVTLISDGETSGISVTDEDWAEWNPVVTRKLGGFASPLLVVGV